MAKTMGQLTQERDEAKTILIVAYDALADGVAVDVGNAERAYTKACEILAAAQLAEDATA
jgi:hypothetical protein